MANVNQKQRYSYRVSYAQEVGSSFDPDIEDMSRWNESLHREMNSQVILYLYLLPRFAPRLSPLSDPCILFPYPIFPFLFYPFSTA